MREQWTPARGDGTLTIQGVRITHPDRVVYPEQRITKRELTAF
jgi:DNA primase